MPAGSPGLFPLVCFEFARLAREQQASSAGQKLAMAAFGLLKKAFVVTKALVATKSLHAHDLWSVARTVWRLIQSIDQGQWIVLISSTVASSVTRHPQAAMS